jgi:uncharacterized membrane protein
MQTNPRPSKSSWLEFVLLASPFLFLAVEWNQFPARIPIHWNIHGGINGTAPKTFGLLMLPVTNVLVYLMLRFIRHFDPKVRRSGAEDREPAMATFRVMRIAIIAFLFGIFCFQAAIALGHPLPFDRLVVNGFLLFFIVTGNYFTTLRPNYFVGIRTPWTLENPETWKATHRVGGRIMVFGGLLLLAIGFLVGRQIFMKLFLVYILGYALWTILYSWNHSRTHAHAR